MVHHKASVSVCSPLMVVMVVVLVVVSKVIPLSNTLFYLYYIIYYSALERLSAHYTTALSFTLVCTKCHVNPLSPLGQYQCHAKNKWGTAITNSVFVRKSEMNNFKDEPPKVD